MEIIIFLIIVIRRYLLKYKDKIYYFSYPETIEHVYDIILLICLITSYPSHTRFI